MKRQKQVHKPRWQRQDEIILTALGQRSVSERNKQFTNAKMAKWLGLSASNKLKKMIDELVSEGWLNREEKIHRTSVNKDGYRLEIKKHVYSLSVEGLERLAML